jgi:hypothetical protein
MWADPGVYAMIGGKPRAREDVWIRLLRSVGCWTGPAENRAHRLARIALALRCWDERPSRLRHRQFRLAKKLGYGAPVQGVYHDRTIQIFHRG